MIVADASAVIEALLHSPVGEQIADRLLDSDETVVAPHLLDLEVLQVLRRYTLSADMDLLRAEEAIEDLGDLPILRYPHQPFSYRIWELRDNLTAYDAAYVAMAEILNAPLLTRDARLAETPGHAASIELF